MLLPTRPAERAAGKAGEKQEIEKSATHDFLHVRLRKVGAEAPEQPWRKPSDDHRTSGTVIFTFDHAAGTKEVDKLGVTVGDLHFDRHKATRNEIRDASAQCLQSCPVAGGYQDRVRELLS